MKENNPNNEFTIRAALKSSCEGEALFIRACGRINIIGEHTDYNDGYVLPASIDKHIFFALSKNGSRVCRFLALDINEEHEADLDNLQKSGKLWANYLTGILQQFQKRGAALEGVDCVFGGDLPIGAGMSSSAALECGFAFGINTLFGLGYSRKGLALLAQRSSHEFVGIKCGIMDQFASLMGKEGQLILLDCRSLEHSYIPFDLGEYQVVLLNSNVHHELASSQYGIRVKECRSGLEFFQNHYSEIESMRDIRLKMLEKHRTQLGVRIYDRCSYVVEENRRVVKACESLKRGDIETLGKLMFQTHQGLRDKYEVSCPEIDFLVEFAKDFAGAIGARVMGGGFGGCTINLVHQAVSAGFIIAAKAAYRQKTTIDADAYRVSVVKGTDVVMEPSQNS